MKLIISYIYPQGSFLFKYGLMVAFTVPLALIIPLRLPLFFVWFFCSFLANLFNTPFVSSSFICNQQNMFCI